MRQVETRYATSGTLRIAYQVVGQGSLDLIVVPGFISNLDMLWELPSFDGMIRRLSAFCRVILFDKAGTGLSDRLDPTSPPDLDRRTDDILAVLDAAGSNSTVLLGSADGAALAIRFAVKNPGRARALILHAAFAKFHGTVMDTGKFGHLLEVIDSSWGTGATAALLAPSRTSDARFVEWWARFERLSASPTTARLLARMTGTIDITSDLGSLDCPVLVVHRTDDRFVRATAVRDLAQRISGARLVGLQGSDHPVWLGDIDSLIDEISEFLTGERSRTSGSHTLAALLVVHIAGAPNAATGRSDSRDLSERIERFQDAVPGLAARYEGRVCWTSASELMVQFNGVTPAVSCSVALRDAAAHHGLSIGQGIHVGEIDVDQPNLSGPAIAVVLRIADSARTSEILLSHLASELVSKSGLQFIEHRAVQRDDGADPVRVVAIATERHLEPKGHRAVSADLGTLSTRERQVLAMVAEGMINSVIAVQLGLSQHTVKRHVANILLKLDLPTRAAAAGVVARQATE